MKLTNEIVISKAKHIGFDLVGFARAEVLNEEIKKLQEWLERKYNSGMAYMERNFDNRKNIDLILPGAKSVISLAKNYYVDEQFSGNPSFGKISRYAWGKDYHLKLWEMLGKLFNEIKDDNPEFEAKYYVDTGPVMDKAWAVKAGIGWMGKHTNIISKEYGSWIFISTVITNCEFDYSETIQDFCGTCTRCIEACPTNAIVDEYLLDAGKCISYLTIENKNDIPDEFSGKLDNWVFGCDICQDVCPWNNKFSEPTNEHLFHPINGNKEIALEEIMEMDEKEFKERFKLSPISRAKLKGLQRNTSFLLKSGTEHKV